jgi:hypothetical protein
MDQYPNPTSYALQPFRGTAVGAAMIMAKGGAGAAKPVSVGTDSKFCIEVTLLPDSPNTVVFTPLDGNGCPGREATISIVHKSSAKKDGGVSSVVNLAKGAPITSELTPEKGLLEYMVDGDLKTSAELSFLDIDWGSCSSGKWVRIDLGKTYTITKVRIRWAADVGGDYGKCYSVLLSSATSPGTPDTSPSGDWTVAKQETAGDVNDPTIILNPTAARWAAFFLYENGSTGLYETFKVAELEVWGQDPNATPPPAPESCK